MPQTITLPTRGNIRVNRVPPPPCATSRCEMFPRWMAPSVCSSPPARAYFGVKAMAPTTCNATNSDGSRICRWAAAVGLWMADGGWWGWHDHVAQERERERER